MQCKTNLTPTLTSKTKVDYVSVDLFDAFKIVKIVLALLDKKDYHEFLLQTCTFR